MSYQLIYNTLPPSTRKAGNSRLVTVPYRYYIYILIHERFGNFLGGSLRGAQLGGMCFLTYDLGYLMVLDCLTDRDYFSREVSTRANEC
jgi:hypothetical protein